MAMNMAMAMAGTKTARRKVVTPMTGRRPSPSQRSFRGWALRLAFAALAIVIGYFSVASSLAPIVVRADPELALRLAPYDGRITAAVSALWSQPEASVIDRRRSDKLARVALRQDLTAVNAAATLGVNAALREDSKAARRFFAYAHTLSRRDLRTQLWMIEDAVQRGSIPDALTQYDATLRVFPSMDKMLYPVLTAASSDPAIRNALVRTLAYKPIWTEGFVDYAADSSKDPQSIALLFGRLRLANVPVSPSARTRLVNALLGTGELDAAWRYYASIRPGSDRRRSRDPRFTASLSVPSQLDWTPVGDGALTSSISSGVFDFAAPAGIGGALLQQGQVLPPGIYRLTGHSIGIDQPDRALPYWTLRCTNGRELGRVALSRSAQANGVFTGTLTVPAGCPTQTLELVAQPSESISGLSGQVDRVELMPL
jgi:hypothetical protein